VVLTLLVMLAGGALWYWGYPDRPGPERAAVATIDIPARTGFYGIKEQLVQAGVIKDDIRFALLAKQMGVARSLKAGEYAFSPRVTPREVLRDLAAGKVVQHAITLAEGLTIYQVADLMQAGNWGGREEFLRLVADAEVLKGFGLQAENLEGYLFPDTYFFAKGTSMRAMVTVMVKRMLSVLEQEEAQPPADGTESNTLPLTRHQVLILASIVEKESALPTERPLVAKVFLNRLRTGMKLQADPTVIYGLMKFGSPLTKSDLATANPYNTYVNFGLPHGPICTPGRTALAAVFRPAALDYYYFVSQNDGSHYFSKTLAEHNQAVDRYRKKRAANGE